MAKGRASGRQNHANVQSKQQSTGSGMTLGIQGNLLTLRSDGAEQSRVDLDHPEVLDFEYMQHLDLLLDSRYAKSQRLHILHAGAGALALPLCWSKTRDTSSHVAVDTDGQMLDLLKEWKVVPPRAHIKLRTGDAREVLDGSLSTYDVIVRDAFSGDRTPGSLTTRQWHELCLSRLRKGGTYLANVAHGPGVSGKDDIAAALQVFPNAVAIADRKVWKSQRRGNVVIACWASGDFDSDLLDERVRRLPLPVAIYDREQIQAWLAGTPCASDPVSARATEAQ